MRVVLALLIIWAALALIGAVVKSLFWLGIVGLALFLATGLYSIWRGRSRILRR
jgi:hypothetical protein